MNKQKGNHGYGQVVEEELAQPSTKHVSVAQACLHHWAENLVLVLDESLDSSEGTALPAIA